MFENKRLNYSLLGFLLTELLIIVFENIGGVSLDEFYWYRYILIQITNVLLPLMPTTGDFAQITKNTIILKDIVLLLLYVAPGIIVASTIFNLIPDER